MIQRLKDIMSPSDRDGERGFTIIEVMVAMMVFAVMSVGIAYGIANTLQLTQNSRGRETAIQLASQDVDQMRQTAAASTTGIFDVVSKAGTANTQTVGGLTFQVDRVAKWVQSDGTSGACGTSNGKLAYKSVVETVSWPNPHGGMSSTTLTSAIAPSSAVTDPGYGTIIVSVADASGAPYQGVPISIALDSGGASTTLTPTDSQGCSYAVNVAEGSYTVTANMSGGIDTNQAQPSQQSQIAVSAGASSPVPFVYDKAASLKLQYAKSYNATLPTNMVTVLSSTAGGLDTVKPWDVASTTLQVNSNTTPTIPVFPFTSGYFAYAGPFSNAASANCASPNPASWSTPNASGAIGVSPSVISVSPGSGASAQVMMGVATVSGIKGRYITAVSSSSPAAGDPGCSVGMTMKFPVASADTATIALPFGTWTIYSGTSFGATQRNEIQTNASNPNVKPVTNGSLNQKTALFIITYDNTLTLDPRGQTS